MKRAPVMWLGCMLVTAAGVGQQLQPGVPPQPVSEQLLREQKHFAECLAYGYSPALWVSYEGSLFFAPKDDGQLRAIDRMKTQRARYLAFTNLVARQQFAARVLAASGLATNWQSNLLLPCSPTNRNLVPSLGKPLTIVPSYTLLQSLDNRDALLQDGDLVYFVTDYGRSPADASRTNAILLCEGTKTYRTVSGTSKTVEAFASVSLNQDETVILNRAVTAFRKESTSLGEQISALKAQGDFEEHQRKATDDAPAFQFMLARDYLQGRGTAKNEKLGLELLNRAAANGSGEAKAYLEQLRASPPPNRP